MHMALSNILKNAQNVDAARNKFRETDGAGGVLAKLALAGVIVQAVLLVRNILFGEKAAAGQPEASAQDTSGSTTEVALATDPAAQATSDDEAGSASVAGASADAIPLPARGSGTSFSRPGAAGETAIPAGADSISGVNRAVGSPVNDNTPASMPFPFSSATARMTMDFAGAAVPPAPGSDRISSQTESSRRENSSGDPPDARANRAPEVKAPLRFGATFVNHAIVIAAADILRHASDADADTLSVGKIIAGQGATLRQVDGAWVLTPAADFKGQVELAFAVSDGRTTTTAKSVVEVLDFAPSVIEASAANGQILGTPRADTIYGSGSTRDIVGREGADVVTGGDGSQRIAGGDGDDVISGGDGDDILMGQAGNDVIFGDAGNDVLDGGAGADVLIGGSGNDTLSGGEGNDVLVGSAGADRLDGGAGDDTIVAESLDGDDVIDGGVGSDTLDLSATTAPAIVDLAMGTAQSQDIGSDSISAIENVIGSSGADTLRGNDDANIVAGGSGSDTIDTAAGDDVVVATLHDGDDTIDGGSGVDTLDYSATSLGVTADLASGRAIGAETGSDAFSGFENIMGGNGTDILAASDLVNVLSGGGGDDVFVFRSTSEAGLGRGNRDVILDFQPGDRIDLQDISREFDRQFGDIIEDAGVKKFTIIGSMDEFARPGQVRFVYEELESRASTVVQGNIDGDAAAEFEIELAGRIVLLEEQLQKPSSAPVFGI